MHRLALELEGLGKGFDEDLFTDLSMMMEVGKRIAVIGQNGVGKSALLKCLVGELEPTAGKVKWSDNVGIGYYAQDHAADFEQDMSLIDWMGQWANKGDDEQLIRGTLGRLLFSQDDIEKSAKVISGGEQGRMLFGKLILQHPNVMLMDEPTNHLDMESIESLNLVLENYPGSFIFVSYDHEFVSSLATRIIEMTPTGIVDFRGPYEEYVRSQDLE